MPRQEVHPRTPFAPLAFGGAGREETVRRSAAPRVGPVMRILLAPFALLAAAAAGLVFVLLLPICGIASIAGAVAQASWALVCGAFPGARRRAAPRS